MNVKIIFTADLSDVGLIQACVPIGLVQYGWPGLLSVVECDVFWCVLSPLLMCKYLIHTSLCRRRLNLEHNISDCGLVRLELSDQLMKL